MKREENAQNLTLSVLFPFYLIDMYPNRMVWYLHEYSLLERGHENPWMDDPSQPQP
jgi:hypothetical protein